MEIILEPKQIQDAYSTPIVQQTTFWSIVKQRLGLHSCAFEFKVRNRDIYDGVGGYCATNADVIMYYQYLNREDYIAYVPYGPEIEPSESNQGVFLEELSEGLRSYLSGNCIAIRYDLNWQSHWCKDDDYDEQGNWLGLPQKEFQEIKLNFGTCNHKLTKANSNILPSNTIVVNLHSSEEEILERMKPKTRYNIRLSERKGVEVRSAGEEGLSVWYRLYTETALRNGLYINDFSYFQTMFVSKMNCEDSDVNVQLLIAYWEGEPLAAMFLVLSAYRATYLYGASSSRNRNVMPTYALQWRAIQIAKRHNCLEYDMFGIAPTPDPSHPMFGLYKFKQGFGGEIYHQLGCWDYPLNDEKYSRMVSHELNMQGYYR